MECLKYSRCASTAEKASSRTLSVWHENASLKSRPESAAASHPESKQDQDMDRQQQTRRLKKNSPGFKAPAYRFGFAVATSGTVRCRLPVAGSIVSPLLSTADVSHSRT